jgi:predicted PurR-regulated permease PerM
MRFPPLPLHAIWPASPIAPAHLHFERTWTASLPALFLTANRFLWIDYVEVRANGKQLDLGRILLLVSLAYWGWFGGVLCLPLAVPMLARLKIGLAQFDCTRRWALLISEE